MITVHGTEQMLILANMTVGQHELVRDRAKVAAADGCDPSDSETSKSAPCQQ